MKYCRLTALILFFLVLPTTGLFALESHTFKNGLELFIEENHVVPLVTIRITFRAGAIVETEDLNGLCHLYEHMLFKGNALYKTQPDFKAALKRMGAGNWNGGTSTEYVTYYITIPGDQLDEGLEFWAYAVKAPLLDKEELAREREVVHNEIAGKQSAPEYALRIATLHALYPDYWFRRHVGGELAVIDGATVEQMLFIKNNYYVPNNAALFIAGDVDPKTVVNLTKKYYGDWARGSGFPELVPHKPLPRNRWICVATNPTKGITSVSFAFRGPDTAIDPDATYAADAWGQMLNDPQGRFKNSIFEKVPELYGGTRYIQGGYFTQRDAGSTTFSFQVQLPEQNAWEVLTRLRNALIEEVGFMTTDTTYFTAAQLSAAKQELENHDILSRETPAGYLSNLSFWWASTSTAYYLSYLDRVKNVTIPDIQAFLGRYVYNKHFLTSVWINKDDDAQHNISAAVKKTEEQ